MSDALDSIATGVLKGLADRAGVQVDAEQLVMLTEKWVSAGLVLLDNHAKAAAHQAGVDAAAKITTIEEAEKSAKSR